MSDIYNPQIPSTDAYTDFQNQLQANVLPPITAVEAFHEVERRCVNGMQYTTFPNTITDEEKAKLEAHGYVVTRNYIPSADRYGQGDLYIGIQVALNSRASEEAMQITPNGSSPSGDTSNLAANLLMELNTSTYVLTAQLINENNQPIGTTQRIDLPLESTVVDARYDATTQSIILILKSGEETAVPVSDLVAGLQAEITTEAPLNADLVSDESSVHKFVTTDEKTAWDAKQDRITPASKISADAVDDSTTTNKFVSDADIARWDAKQAPLTFDTAPADLSTNPVTSGGIYTALDTKADKSTIYTKSEVNSALRNKQNTLTFDSTPTSGSTNPVTSGGVYTALAGKSTVTVDTNGNLFIDGQQIWAVLTSAEYNALTTKTLPFYFIKE